MAGSYNQFRNIIHLINFFCQVSQKAFKKVQPAAVAADAVVGTALRMTAFAAVVVAATLATCHCVSLLLAQAVPSSGQYLMPLHSYPFRFFLAGRPLFYFLQSVFALALWWNFLFHQLFVSFLAPKLSMATFPTSSAFSLSTKSSFLLRLFL